MFQTIYQMTPKETQFYHETDRQRFLNLLNLGIESPTKLLIQPHSTNIFTRDEPDCCIVVAYGLPQGQEALFETDWVEERVRSIISIMHSEEELSQMVPTKIVSQIIFFSSTSQFTPLIQLLKSLQKKVKTNPREYRRFDQMIQEHTRRLEALQEAGNSGMNDDDFDDDETACSLPGRQGTGRRPWPAHCQSF